MSLFNKVMVRLGRPPPRAETPEPDLLTEDDLLPAADAITEDEPGDVPPAPPPVQRADPAPPRSRLIPVIFTLTVLAAGVRWGPELLARLRSSPEVGGIVRQVSQAVDLDLSLMLGLEMAAQETVPQQKVIPPLPARHPPAAPRTVANAVPVRSAPEQPDAVPVLSLIEGSGSGSATAPAPVKPAATAAAAVRPAPPLPQPPSIEELAPEPPSLPPGEADALIPEPETPTAPTAAVAPVAEVKTKAAPEPPPAAPAPAVMEPAAATPVQQPAVAAPAPAAPEQAERKKEPPRRKRQRTPANTPEQQVAREMLRARAALAMGDLPAVERILTAVPREHENRLDYLSTLAAWQSKSGAHEQAARVYRRLIILEPEQSHWWLGLAVSQDRLGNHGASAFAYRQAAGNKDLEASVQRFVLTRLQELSQPGQRQ